MSISKCPVGHGEGQVVGQTWTFLHFLHRGWTGGLEICDFRVLLVLCVHPHWVHPSWTCWICGTEFQHFVVSVDEEASVAAAESFRGGH